MNLEIRSLRPNPHFQSLFRQLHHTTQSFAMEDAIALKLSETWEAIAEIIRQHSHREQVELLLGAMLGDR
jgi:hypothetical protein